MPSPNEEEATRPPSQGQDAGTTGNTTEFERSARRGIRGRSLAGVPIDALLGRLEELDAQPSLTSEGQIRARCIAHGGQRLDSLAIDPTEDGRRWVAYCHAQNCPQETIFAAILARGPLERVAGPVAETIPARARR